MLIKQTVIIKRNEIDVMDDFIQLIADVAFGNKLSNEDLSSSLFAKLDETEEEEIVFQDIDNLKVIVRKIDEETFELTYENRINKEQVKIINNFISKKRKLFIKISLACKKAFEEIKTLFRLEDNLEEDVIELGELLDLVSDNKEIKESTHNKFTE